MHQLKFTDYSILLGIHFRNGYVGGREQQLAALKKSKAPVIPATIDHKNVKLSVPTLIPKPIIDNEQDNENDEQRTSYVRTNSSSHIFIHQGLVAAAIKNNINKQQQQSTTTTTTASHPLFDEANNGIASRTNEQIFYFGVIDMLTEFTIKKSAERNLKSLKYPGRRNEISAQPPDEYATRLKTFVNKIIV